MRRHISGTNRTRLPLMEVESTTDRYRNKGQMMKTNLPVAVSISLLIPTGVVCVTVEAIY